MKKITLLFFALLALPIHAQWIEQNSGVTVGLNDVYCINENTVVVIGDAGTILKTTDGGTTWLTKSSGITENLQKVQFASANVGFAVSANGTVLKTTDAGESWFLTGTASLPFTRGFSCVNDNTVYVSNGGMKKSTDGGLTFALVSLPESILNFQFLSEQVGYAYSEDTLYKTIDAGATWTAISTGFYHIRSFFFTQENTGLIYTANGNYSTTDGGVNLTNIGNSEGDTLDLYAFNENVIWEVKGIFLLCGCDPSYCVSKWNMAEIPENQRIENCDLDPSFKTILSAISFANPTNGYLVGRSYYDGPFGPPSSKGAIFKNTTGTMLATESVQKEADLKIYPNPSAGDLTVYFSELPAQPFTIELTDILGKNVKVRTSQAENTLKVHTANLSKGIYFLTVNNQGNRQTQKIILN